MSYDFDFYKCTSCQKDFNHKQDGRIVVHLVGAFAKRTEVLCFGCYVESGYPKEIERQANK